MILFSSFAIFLFAALSLVIPSGFTYGPLLLFLGSFTLLSFRNPTPVRLEDSVFVLTLAFYVMISILLNIYHHLPVSAYDKPMRYMLAIPVYFLLINYSPKQSYFWWGLIFGALGAITIALLQRFNLFFSMIWIGRSSGFLNPIQFGDISLLMAGILAVGLVSANNRNIYFLCLVGFSCFAGLLASILSATRGGWPAIPLFVFVLYKISSFGAKKLYIYTTLLFFICSLLFYFLLPKNNFFKLRVIQTQSNITAYVHNGATEQSDPVSVRLEMYLAGLEAFKEKPILGWGELSSIKESFPSRWAWINRQDNFNHLHNEYIDALAKKGLVGFTALMAMYLVPLYYFVGLMRTRQADVMPFAAAGVVLILCVMVFGLTQCFLAHNSGTMVFVFYLVIIKAYCRNIVAARIPAHQA